MRLQLPPVMGVDEKYTNGVIQQLLLPSQTLEASMTRFTIPSAEGWMFEAESGRIFYVFHRSPLPQHVPQDGASIVARVPSGVDEVDLRKAKWFSPQPAHENPSDLARSSWRTAFKYVGESEAGDGRIGLRKPQIGALHAIHAHWSTSSGVATVVMPTGTGKTETMLATLVTAMCERLLVLVPTDALRSQIAEKFFTLGILKHPNCMVLDATATRPVVGTLTRRPTTPAEVDEFFGRCNVIVTTSALAGGCSDEVQSKMAELCSHLFIDEAHHAEAPTWKQFKSHFKLRGRPILQFTATPFREDGAPMDGKILYVYPLRLAQQDGYFRPIQFRPVYAFNPSRADRDIAASVVHELEVDPTGRHVAMARVATKIRAAEVLELYREIGRYNPVMLHSSMPVREQTETRQMLESGQARIVVCVDMLGEGFDMPELKIAAFHDLRKSLAVTLQLAGRFTRARPDLGDPVFIANTADVNLRDELRALYAQDPDWNLLLPELSDSAIGQEVDAQEFLHGFVGELPEIPLAEIHPAASMVVYRTRCVDWEPNNYRRAFRGSSEAENIYPILNSEERTLIVIAARRQGVAWTDISSLDGTVWELCIAVWDQPRALLYIHGSTNNGNYNEFARALCGNDVSLVTAPDVFRVFGGINRLMLTNVGLDEQLGRQIRYTGRMGPDVGARISEATLATTTKAVLAGVGFEQGEQTTMGAGKRGRVWSNLRLRMNSFSAWCKRAGEKIADDEIDPEEVLRGTLIPRLVENRPSSVVVGVDWPNELLDYVESATAIAFSVTQREHLTNVGIEVLECSAAEPLGIRVFTETSEVRIRLNFVGHGAQADFAFTYDGVSRAEIHRGRTIDLCDFFTEFPPTFWFADGSKLEGNLHTELRAAAPLFSPERMEVIDWSGINIRKESQREERHQDSVQFRAIETLKADGIIASSIVATKASFRCECVATFGRPVVPPVWK